MTHRNLDLKLTNQLLKVTEVFFLPEDCSQELFEADSV